MAERPLSSRLREAADRLDYVGDPGDREAVLEAVRLAAADEQARAESRQTRLGVDGGTCPLCEQPIDPLVDVVLHEESGWVERRDAGGTNALRLRRVTGRRAHASCVAKQAAVGVAQDELL